MNAEDLELINQLMKTLEQIDRLLADNERLREALTDVGAHLVAATSLLKRGGKKAAPSDKMFFMMIADYEASSERARNILTGDTNGN